MVAVFGLHEGYRGELVSRERLCSTHPMCDVHWLAHKGLLSPSVAATIGGGERDGGYRLAVREAGIMELDGQPIQLGWHPVLPLRVFICPRCGRDCYKLHRVNGAWACRRRCHALSYSSRHVYRAVPKLHRAKWLRSRLSHYGVSAELFSPIEPRPLSHRRFWRLALELRAIEGGLVEHLRVDVADVLEKRDGKRRTRPRGDPA